MKKAHSVVTIIPARYESTRFPGKPLALLCGKPMIQWVYEAAGKARNIAGVYVATDDKRIYDCVHSFGGEAIMTGECSCGSERVYEAVRDMDCLAVINVQGDEPLITPEIIDNLAEEICKDDVEAVTLKRRIENLSEINNPNLVKVITDGHANALYFSRLPIPYNRDNSDIEYYAHIGVYAYKKDFLKAYNGWEQTVLEKAEKLEQLRILENGHSIKVLETRYNGLGVDTLEDLRNAEKILSVEEQM